MFLGTGPCRAGWLWAREEELLHGGTTVVSESQQGLLVLPGFPLTVAECGRPPGKPRGPRVRVCGFPVWLLFSPYRKRNAPVHLSRRQTTKEAMVWVGVLAARVRPLDLGAMAPACQAFPWPWGGRCVRSFRPLCPHSPTQSAAALSQQTKAHGSSCYTHSSEVTAKRARTAEATANRPVTHQATGAGGRSNRWPCPGTMPPTL